MLKCRACGETFKALPSSLYMGHGCPRCAGVKHKTHEEFISEIKTINPQIQVLSTYRNSKSKVALRCSICGHSWMATPNSLLSGKGCAYCAGTLKKTTEKFVEEMQKIHPTIEVKGNYINNKTKILCRCMKCDTYFYGIPHSMVDSGHGCINCSSSHGERKIRDWLTSHGFNFITEHKFDDCKDIRALPFDFFLPDLNTAIEFDGQQHYDVNRFFGGEPALIKRKLHDNIKNEYCLTHNIHLIRIPHWDFEKIDQILFEQLAN